MKITKRQLRRIIKEEKRKLHELGIDRTARDMALDDPDDLTIGVETYEKIVDHLQALNDIIESDNNRGGGSIDHYSNEVNQIKALLPWAQDMLKYWKEE
jgi:hypothetical protein